MTADRWNNRARATMDETKLPDQAAPQPEDETDALQP